jgi:ubiquinone/menaquinone biosynthesis C-methylase UbiE
MRGGEREYPDLMARAGLTVLDLGSGNGGMLFPFAGRARLAAVDLYVDLDLVAFRQAAGLRMLHLVGDAARIPLAGASVDLVLMAETLEHLPEPKVRP